MKRKCSINKLDIMKKPQCQQYCHCFIVCICILAQLLVKCVNYCNKRRIYRCGTYQRGGAYFNMDTQSSSAYQRAYLRLQRLFKARRLLEEIRYIKCYIWSRPRPVKVLTIRRPAVVREDLKPYWKSEKRSPIQLLTSLSKTFLTAKRRLIGRQFLTVDLTQTFLNTGNTTETFQQCEKQDSLRHLLKSSASM